MEVLDLFSGIGGFSLGLERAGMKTIQFVEKDKFCQKVLRKHWPGVPIHGDITTFKYDGPSPFILTGGFPCQPFSCAGKRRGKEDDRYLWPEMLRVISESKPRWVIGENVGGFVNMGLDECISDLEAEGYEVQPLIIPACALNAPHRRDRVWIVAKSNNSGITQSGIQQSNISAKSDSHASDTADARIEGVRREREDSVFEAATNNNKRLEGQWEYGECPGERITGAGAWKEPWIEAATRLCGMDARIPAELDIIRGLENEKMEGLKTESEINFFIREVLLYVWEHRETSKTSPDLYERGFYNIVPGLPQKRTHKEWNLGSWCEENADLCCLWSRFYSERFPYSQNMQYELLEHIGKIERRKKMERKDRVNRLKSLGNAVVPQIVEMIGRSIIKAERKSHEASAP